MGPVGNRAAQGFERSTLPTNRRARHAANEQGGVFVFVAIAMVAMIGFVALVFDFGEIFNARAELQTAADSAVIAAANELPDPVAASAAAVQYANANDAGHGPVVLPEDVVVGRWDDDTDTFLPGAAPANAIRVNAQRSNKNGNPIETLFGGLFGFDSVQVSAESIGARDVLADLVILQDVTVSFLDELPIAIDADKAMVDAFANEYPGGVQMGAVSFARNTTLVYSMELLETGQEPLKTALDNMDKCTSAGSPGGPCYGTDIGLGINAAAAHLQANGRPNVIPVIVLVSDGTPCIGEASDPVGEGQAIATAAADAAGAAGISIFSVTLYEPVGSTSPCYTSNVTFNNSLARGVGWGVTTTDETQLAAFLTSILNEMPVRLVK